MKIITINEREIMEGAGMSVLNSVFLLLSEKNDLADKISIISLKDKYQSMVIDNIDDVHMDTDFYKNGNNSIKNQDQRVIVFDNDKIIKFTLPNSKKIQYLGFKGYKCLITENENDFNVKERYSDAVKKTINWFVNSKTSASSRTLAYHLVLKDNLTDEQMEKAGISPEGKPFGYDDHPCDPSDLKRCMDFFEAVPEVKNNLKKMGGVSKEWKTLVSNWYALEASFNTEYEANKNNKKINLPNTYSKMKYVLESVIDQKRHSKLK